MTSKKIFDSRAELPPGGSYRKRKDGKVERIDTPQKPNPGKTALRRQAAAKSAAKKEG